MIGEIDMSEMIFMNECKVAKFPAPEGKNYRKIVKDYMMKMAMVMVEETMIFLRQQNLVKELLNTE